MVLCFVRGLGYVARYFKRVNGRFVRLYLHLRPLLFHVVRPIQVIRVFSHARASRPVIHLDVFFISGIGVVHASWLSVVLFKMFGRVLVCVRLRQVDFVVYFERYHFVTLRFRVVVISGRILVPLSNFFYFHRRSLDCLFKRFATRTHEASGRAFIVFLRLIPIYAKARVMAFNPYPQGRFCRIVVPLLIFNRRGRIVPTLIELSLLFVRYATDRVRLATCSELRRSPFHVHCFDFAIDGLNVFVHALRFANFGDYGPLLRILCFSFQASVFLVGVIHGLFGNRRISVIHGNGAFRPIFRDLVSRYASANLAVRGEVLHVSIWVGRVLRDCELVV